jgi:DNA-binding beta-propeller fold protein YncE
MTKRKSALIIVLVIILGICGYNAKAEMAFHTPPLTHEVLQAGPPQYLFTIDGQDKSDPSAGLKGPLAITSSPDGKIFVADTGNSQIKVFTSNGKLLNTFGKGILNYPFGLTYADSKLYVADPNMMKISVFDDQGQQLAPLLEKMQLPLAGGNLGEIIRPTGIQRNAEGNFYITDVGNQCVVVLDPSGRFVKSIGSRGTEDGHFQYPNALAISSEQKLYVSDSNNGRIQIFDQDGGFLYKINGSQGRSGLLSLPRGIVTTSDGTTLVVDVFMHKVRAFDQAGYELWTFGGMGTGFDSFNFPNGLYVDEAAGRIYITDRENNRIQVLGYL